MHTLRATRNEHNWTCTVPWHVFLLCVKTLQMTMTMIREGETMKQMSWEHMPAVKAGNACPKAKGSYYCDVRGSDQTFLLLEVSRRRKKSPKILKSLRMDPIMSCCDQCKWYCAACCWNSEKQTSLNRKKRHQHTHTPAHLDTRTPIQKWSHQHRRRDTPAPTCPRTQTTTTVLCWAFSKDYFFPLYIF